MDALAMTLFRSATLAPSGHNTQPWRFSADDDAIRIYPDFTRRLPVVDPDDHALYISLGCAAENLVIAAAHHGLAANVEAFPADEPAECIRIRLAPGPSSDAGALFAAIPERQSNRRSYDRKPIPAADIDQLLAANTSGTVSLQAFDPAQPDCEPIIALVREGNVAQFKDPAFVDELVSWIRFSPAEVRARQDGLTASALGFPSVPRWLGQWIMTTLVKPHSEASKQAQAIGSSALLLLFVAQRNDKRHWVDVGRSFERVALTATALGVAHAHVNMPCEVEPIRRRLALHLGLAPDAQPLLLIRLGYAKPLQHSPRRPVEQVLREATH
jgi:nitroreductase